MPLFLEYITLSVSRQHLGRSTNGGAVLAKDQTASNAIQMTEIAYNVLRVLGLSCEREFRVTCVPQALSTSDSCVPVGMPYNRSTRPTLTSSGEGLQGKKEKKRRLSNVESTDGPVADTKSKKSKKAGG